MTTTLNSNIKSAATDRDTIIGRALSKAIANSQPIDACPSSEQLAVLVDGTATEVERETLLGHLSQCDRCREVYLLTHDLNVEEPVQQNYRGWYLAGGTFAAVALVALALNLTFMQEPPVKPRTAHIEMAPSPQVALLPAAALPTSPIRATPIVSPVQNGAATVLNLVTLEEATQPGVRSYGFAGNSRTDGPEIRIESPAEVSGDLPIPTIRILFMSHDGSASDPASFRLEYVKQNPIDLTSRIKSFASDTEVNLRQIRLPEGLHQFRFTIADVRGRISEKDFTILVSGTF